MRIIGHSTEAVNIWCDLVGKLGIYRQKTALGIPPNFRSSLAPKLLVRLKNQGRCKNGTDILYVRAMFGGNPPLYGGVRKKSWEFFIFVCCALDLELE